MSGAKIGVLDGIPGGLRMKDNRTAHHGKRAEFDPWSLKRQADRRLLTIGCEFITAG